MITAPTFTIKGSEADKTTLPEKIFGVKASERLLTQAVRVYLSNQRKAHAKTKTRGEITKTTAKMYKQKGTGRARHGAASAPIFVGGGVAHGPTGTQNYKMTLSAKMNNLAILGALSDKAHTKSIVVLSGTDKADGKTKEGKTLLDKFNKNKSTLVVATSTQKMFTREIKNINKVSVSHINSLNAYEIIKCQILAITAEAISELTKKYEA